MMGFGFSVFDVRSARCRDRACAESHLTSSNHKLKTGFTLIELVLVMFVLTIMLSVVAPSLRGWSRGGRLRDAGDQFLAATRFARSAAISTASLHQLQVDPGMQAYMILRFDDGQWVSATGEFSRPVTLPSSMHMELSRLDGSAAAVIEFHPSGRVTPAQVRVVAEWGDAVELSAQTAAEPFRDTTGRSQ